MKCFQVLCFLCFLSCQTFGQGVFLSIEGTFGRHNVQFKEFSNSPGASFGFKVSAGLLVIQGEGYQGGPQYTLIEGASYNKNRRRLSEDFVLNDPSFDKHIVYKFAMFRSSNVGWASFIPIGNGRLYHTVGFGIFGLTENDPLMNFGIHNSLGIELGQRSFRWKFGLGHDLTIGNGNPNYSISNLALNMGLIREI